jgi:hypothetical protein
MRIPGAAYAFLTFFIAVPGGFQLAFERYTDRVEDTVI